MTAPDLPDSYTDTGHDGSGWLIHCACAVLVGSSGDGDLDRLAQRAVMRWRMNPSNVTQADITQGRGQIIGFRQGRGPRTLVPPGSKPYWTRS